MRRPNLLAERFHGLSERLQLRLTKRTVDALTVGTKDTLFWDRNPAGFGVRVHATGRKVYVVQSRGPMGLRRVTLGRHGDIFTEERRKQVAVVIDRIKRGEDPIPAPPEPELSVADLAERFMRLHVKVNCKPSTAAIYRGHLDGHILPALGEMAISAVGRGEIAALHHGSATHRPLPMRSSGPYRSCTHRGRDPAPASC